MTTIEEAKIYLRENWNKGCDCPVCTQFVRLWKQKINSQIAKCLISLYLISKSDNKRWVHILREIKPSNRMYSLARWWGLIEAKEYHGEDDKKSSGYWCLTIKGINFVENKIKIPKYALLFNNHFYKFSGEDVDISDALGQKFSYRELMGSYYKEPIEPKQESLL